MHFIEKWDASAGQLIYDEDLMVYVSDKVSGNFEALLSAKKIQRIVEIILAYLRQTGHYYNHELQK